MSVAKSVNNLSAASNSTFSFERIKIEKVVSLTIPMKNGAGNLTPLQPARAVAQLPRNAIDALQRRLTEALNHRSHAVEMNIDASDTDSFFQSSCQILNGNDIKLIDLANAFAVRLARTQVGTSALPGILAVIRGRIGAAQQRFVAAIKADIVDGFTESTTQFEYVDRVFLTPSQRLYKIGLLIEVQSELADDDGLFEPINYRAFLFDHLLTATETRAAASYFYLGFLGFALHKSTRKLTQEFYEFTIRFIEDQPILREEKLDLREQLRAELRSGSGLVHVKGFAKAHLPTAMRKPYEEFMAERGFPKHAVQKDAQYVSAKLRRPRRIVFDTQVKIESPADGNSNLVRIVDETNEETTVVIRGRISSRD